MFKEHLYDADAAKEYAKMLREYFSDIIHKNDVIFDVGYSGRMETALGKLLGFPVNSYYFHVHEPWALMRKHNNNFSIDSFYGFKPCSAFVLREQIFTPAQPSCVGFERKGDTVAPVFGEYSADYKEQYILSTIQKNSLKFVEDMINIFGNDLYQLQFNRFDACIPFEYFLHYAKPFDRKIMSAIDFEDEFGTNAVLSIEDYWNNEQKTFNLYLHNLNSAAANEERVNAPVVPTNVPFIIEQARASVYEEEGIFKDGVFIKLYRKLDKAMPKGSRRRNFMKKVASLFVK